MLKCKQLNYNWRQVPEGEEFDSYVLGQGGVIKISNMTPQCEDSDVPEFYDVKFSNGDVTTIYNPNQAFYKDE